MELNLINISLLSDVWPLVQQNVANAVKFSSGRHTSKTILDELIKGSMQLWILSDNGELLMPIITQIRTYPTGLKVCDFVAAAGKGVGDWIQYSINEITLWAKNFGCSRMEVVGRPGWERLLKNVGKKLSVVIEWSI